MRCILMLFLVLGSLAAPVIAAAETQEDLQKKFEGRLGTLQNYKDEGRIGETHEGYIEALKEEYLKDEELKKVVDEENADRKKLYEIIAKEQSSDSAPVTAAQVGKQNAILKFKKASDQEYFKAKDGQWRKKEEMVKKE